MARLRPERPAHQLRTELQTPELPELDRLAHFVVSDWMAREELDSPLPEYFVDGTAEAHATFRVAEAERRWRNARVAWSREHGLCVGRALAESDGYLGPHVDRPEAGCCVTCKAAWEGAAK